MVINPDVLLVQLRIHQLQVVEVCVGVGQDAFQVLVGGVAAGVDVHPDALVIQPPGQLLHVVDVLRHHLAA